MSGILTAVYFIIGGIATAFNFFILAALFIALPCILIIVIAFGLVMEGFCTEYGYVSPERHREEEKARKAHYAEYYGLDPYTRIHG